MSLTVSYFEFRQGESKDYDRCYMIEIQRSMNSKEPMSDGASLHAQVMNGVNRGPLYTTVEKMTEILIYNLTSKT